MNDKQESPQPPPQQYSVASFSLVKARHVPVTATSYENAIEVALRGLDMDDVIKLDNPHPRVLFTEDSDEGDSHFLVDVIGDDEFNNSRWFHVDAQGKLVPGSGAVDSHWYEPRLADTDDIQGAFTQLDDDVTGAGEYNVYATYEDAAEVGAIHLAEKIQELRDAGADATDCDHAVEKLKARFYVAEIQVRAITGQADAVLARYAAEKENIDMKVEDRNAVRDRILELAAETSRVEPVRISRATTFAKLRMDVLAVLELCIDVENEYGIVLDEGVELELATVGQLIDKVIAKKAEAVTKPEGE